MTIQVNRRLVIVSVCLALLIIVFIYTLHQGPPLGNIEHVEEPLITCGAEDLTDTRFIEEVNRNDTVYIPAQSVLERLSREELATLYHSIMTSTADPDETARYESAQLDLQVERYVGNIQYLCRRKLRLGSMDDGGWDVCDEGRLRPVPPCIVYSFGINNDFSFDDAVIQTYGCEVHSFDPSMGVGDFRRGPLSEFHAVGIAATDRHTDGWNLLSYASIRSTLGHTQKEVSLLKLDIEKWEWQVLPGMVRSGALRHVDQLLIELHLEVRSPEQNRDTYLMALKILKDLYDTGFRIFWTSQNKWCQFVSKCKGIVRTNCHEVNLIKVI